MMLPRLELKRKSFISASCIITAFFLLSASSRAGNNSCSLGEVHTIDDYSFSVEIIVTNDDTLAGFQIPFTFDYGDIEVSCDSVTYAGNACEDFAIQDVRISIQAKRVFLAALHNSLPEHDNPPLAPGTHVVARAYFTLAEVNSNRALTFQETAIPDDHRNYSLMMWTPQAEKVPCLFDFSSLRIQ